MLTVAAGTLLAQAPTPVAIYVKPTAVKVGAGEKFQVVLTAVIKKPWHINSDRPHDEMLIPTTLSAEGTGVTLAAVAFPKAHDVKLAFSEKPVSVFEESADFKLTFQVAPSAPAGAQSFDITFDFQACNDVSCLAPDALTVSLDVTVEPVKKEVPASVPPAPEKPRTAAPQTTPSDTTDVSPADTVSSVVASEPPATVTTSDAEASLFDGQGLLVSLMVIFLGGLALNLTPCVYPLIPITIGYFGGQSEGSTGRLFLLGLLYMLGMALTYSVVGVVTALSGAMFGTLLQNVYVIIGIAALFVVLALSQFGVYEFKLPDSWTAAAGGARTGLYGAFFMGLTMGIVAAPCIGPFVLGLVTYVAAKGDPMLGFLMFFVLALGLGLPYLFLVLFSGKIKSLPRSGEWMEGVKHVFGFLLLGMAVYFIGPVLPNAFQTYALPVFGLLAAAILLFFDTKGNSVRAFHWFKVAFSVVVLAVSAYAMVPSQRTEPEWQAFTEERFDASTRNGERMIIDIYAEWCIPCKELDARTFSDPRVVDAFNRFTAYKVDVTQAGSEETKRRTEQFRVVGVPTVLIIDAQGREVERITGFVDAEEFLRRMRPAM